MIKTSNEGFNLMFEFFSKLTLSSLRILLHILISNFEQVSHIFESSHLFWTCFFLMIHNRCEISWNFLSDCLQISITILSKFERINCLISPLKWSENPWIFRNFQEISWIWVVIICRKKHVQNTRLVTFQSQKLWHKSNDLGLLLVNLLYAFRLLFT